MKRQKTPKLFVGKVLYKVMVCGDNKIHVDEWHVRTIQLPRIPNWRTRVDFSKRVNIAVKNDETFDSKAGKWYGGIRQMYKMQFRLEAERLPEGFYTTKLNALKYALYDGELSLERYKQWLEDEADDPEETEFNLECIKDQKNLLKRIKGLITKHKKLKQKALLLVK